MAEYIYDVEQGSEEWHQLRCGRITASNIDKVMAGGKGLTRKAYMNKKVGEILTGEVADSFTSEAMEWGIKTEPQARAMYELETGNDVTEVGFVIQDKYLGVSPDGLVGEDGLVEIKCPNTATHISYIESGKVPTNYMKQIQCQLWVTGRQWCDFVSFDPRIKGEGQMLIIRVERDEKMIEEINKAVLVFIAEMVQLKFKVEGLKDV